MVKSARRFGAALMVAGATRKTETLPVNLYFKYGNRRFDKAMASAIILLIISFSSLLIFNAFNNIS
jgi:ABC-type sulfate transport system permease component